MKKFDSVFNQSLRDLIKPEKYMPSHYVRDMEKRAERDKEVKKIGPLKPAYPA